MLGCKEAERRAGGKGVLSSRACLTTPAVASRKTVSMFGWFRTTSIFINPSGVPIVNFSSCLPTEADFSIPKICPPALCTTWAYLLSASAKLVMSCNPPIRIENRKGPPCLHGRRHFLDGHRRPRLHRGCSLALAISLAKYPGERERQASRRRVRGRGKPLFVAVQRFSQMRPSALPSSRGTLSSPARCRIQERELCKVFGPLISRLFSFA
jgi:hypothetical protein